MANRRSHKKLRAEAKARMARTGESYQRALQQVLAERERHELCRVEYCRMEHSEFDGFELTEFTYFGKPAMLATWQSFGTHGAMLLSDTLRHTLLWSKPLFGRRR
jgi:hypothetical protein